MTQVPSFDEISLSTMAFWSLTADKRDQAFAVLRRERPISRQPAAEGGLVPPDSNDPGYWAVVRHEDVVAVSRSPEKFCSGQGVMVEDIPLPLLEMSMSFLAMDAPRHSKLRRLVGAAFTPRQVATIEAQIRAQARAIVDDLAPLGECDFVHQVSRRLPSWTFSEMMGVPPAEREEVEAAADAMVDVDDPDVLAGRDPTELLVESLMKLHGAARAMAEERRQQPAEDLMTALVEAEVDGERLTDDEIAASFVLLSVAGNDTTRNTISHSMKALCDFPDQRRLLVEEFPARIGPAVEECIRWATPVLTFRRTATTATELRGQPIAAGDKLVLFYASANRDERVFDDPWRFDITRQPNPHVGFGGGGAHFCLGAAMARLQLRSLLGELLARLPDLEVGDPQYLVSNFIHGIKSMPCRFSATR